MNDKERKSCISTIELLRRLAFNVHGVMDVIDAQNCDKIIEMLNKPEPHWIPCSERLPEDYEDVLITISIPNRESKVRSGYYHNGLFNNDNGDCWDSTDPEVKGWCKLPEPYKPESEE